MADRPPTAASPVYVIGGGPGGLAAAAALGACGVRAVVLEKSDAVGASWRAHYRRIRLHTTRRRSALPGLRIPRSYGRWVGGEDFARYLERYAEHHRLEIVTGVEVSRIERTPEDDGWLLRATGGRALFTPAVVVATGAHRVPRLPDWPGRDGFTGELLHASDYRDPAPYRNRDVLVVGAGNTGAEIAVDLAEGGAERVRLAVRTPPHILRRSVWGWPAQSGAVLVRRLPRFVVNPAARGFVRLTTPDLAPHGLPRPGRGLATRVRQGVIPVYDAGLIAAVRSGRVEVVPAVKSLDDGKLTLADGSLVAPEVVIAATGYERGLDPFVGHLDVLDTAGKPRRHGRRTLASAPGLHFTGFTDPVSGKLRELGRDAKKIARAISRAF